MDWRSFTTYPLDSYPTTTFLGGHPGSYLPHTASVDTLHLHTTTQSPSAPSGLPCYSDGVPGVLLTSGPYLLNVLCGSLTTSVAHLLSGGWAASSGRHTCTPHHLTFAFSSPLSRSQSTYLRWAHCTRLFFPASRREEAPSPGGKEMEENERGILLDGGKNTAQTLNSSKTGKVKVRKM